MALLATPLITAGAAAIPIATWDLANATGQTAAVFSTAANLTATAIAPSAGVTPWSSTAEDGFIAASGWANAVPDPTRYYEWSITAAPGYAVDYQSITLALFRGVQSGLHGAEMWDLHASTDGFAASNLSLLTFDISASAPDEQTIFSGAGLSALGIQAGTVTFRLYGYDYTSPTDFSGFGNDSGWLIGGTGTSPVIEGVVLATPEPGTGMLVCVGLFGLGLARRRTRSVDDAATERDRTRRAT